MAGDLDGRAAIVTGAGQGIGRAVALALAAAGARVVVNDIGRGEDGRPTAEHVVAEIEGSGGHAVASLESVTDFEAAGRIVATALECFGSADILINNAGVAARGSILETDAAEFARVATVHIDGSFNCTRQVVEPMVERRWGRIVNLVSRAGITGMPGTIAYAMGKGAVLGLTNGASRELGEHGITMNGVCPSSTRTEMVESAIETLRQGDAAAQARADSLLSQMQTPDQVARPIVALCTEAAGAVNGQVFLLEHGRVGLFQPLTVTQHVTSEPDWSASELGQAIASLELHGLTDAYG
jgi:NAD(P)-dependent dehydrogenase (short-subunit alcohol dehydrogenase family)